MYSRNEMYEDIANEIIMNDTSFRYIPECGVTFCICSCDKKKVSNNKVTYADCRKIPDVYKWCIPYDFQITVYEPNAINLDQEQLKVLIYHELMHIGAEIKDGQKKLSIRPHDIQDFAYILEKYGIHWNQTK